MKKRQSNISLSLREELEFDKIIKLLEGFSKSVSNKERIRNLSILHNHKVLNHHLDRLQEYQTIHSDTTFPAFEYVDLVEVIKMLRIENAVLSEDQFFEIYQASIWVNSVLHFLNSNEYEVPNFIQIIGELKKSPTIKKRIEKVFTTRRYIRSSASTTLESIRADIQKKRSLVDKYFQEGLAHYRHLGFLDEIRESFADGVSLLAVSSEYKRKVKGQVRGQSKTKSISFIEPENCISLNRELGHLYQEEKEEIRQVFQQLTVDLSEHLERIESYHHIIEEVDFLNAKLYLANLMDAHRPKVSASREINIKQAYHPLLLIENKRKKVKTIAQDIYFDPQHRVIVISGPNAGGKSITLKTFGLNQLMLQSGLFIPVHPNSSMSAFHNIFTDIGDNQSIENELSTYSYRLKRMKDILVNAGKSSFILIDEFGSGSDPALGGELASVFFQEIVKSGAYGIITTHYGNIKALADQTENAENACMLFDEEELRPLYRLKVGQPGSSYTFEVARNVGLPEELIDKARAGMKKGTIRFEDSIHRYQRLSTELQLSQEDLKRQESRLENQQKDYAEKLKDLDRKIESQRFTMEFESRYLHLGKRLNKLIEAYRAGATIRSIVPRFKKLLEVEVNKKEEKTPMSAKEAQVKAKRTKDSFSLGQEVRIEGTNQVGEILELKSKSALLQIGFAKMEVKFDKLEAVQSTK